MMNTQQCKDLIAQKCQQDPDLVISQFVDETVDPIPSFHASNWKRMEKNTDNGKIVRGFDCKPYDDQLRAYVETDLTGNLISVVIQGE